MTELQVKKDSDEETVLPPVKDDRDLDVDDGSVDVSTESVQVEGLGSGRKGTSTSETNDPIPDSRRKKKKKKKKDKDHGTRRRKGEEKRDDQDDETVEKTVLVDDEDRIGLEKTQRKKKVTGNKKRKKKVGTSKGEQEDDGSSAWLLTDLSAPQIFEGPEVELQERIVNQLEATIPALDKAAAKRSKAAKKNVDTWHEKWRAKALKKGWGIGSPERNAHNQEHKKRLALVPPDTYDTDVLYLGAIELTSIPRDEEEELELMKTARLTTWNNHELGSSLNGSLLPQKAKVDQDIVVNTLQTMKKARQIEYLRRAGFVGDQWKVLVEVHYYRSRSKKMTGLHKDTVGDTLFVNLSYTNSEDAPGPEWIVNPPPEPSHDERLTTTLPEEVRNDIAETRKIGSPTTIETGIMKPNSVVAFVDETIHHSTPLLGHRTVAVGEVVKFLRTDPELGVDFESARTAYDTAGQPSETSDLDEKRVSVRTEKPKKKREKEKGGSESSEKPTRKKKTKKTKKKKNRRGFSIVDDQRAFHQRFGELAGREVSEAEADVWRALMELCSGDPAFEVDRLALVNVGLTHEQVDRLLQHHGPPIFNSVNISPLARTLTEDSPDRLPMKSDTGEPLALQRRMSLLDREGGSLPQDNPDVPRRFFRTWVRIIPTGTTPKG